MSKREGDDDEYGRMPTTTTTTTTTTGTRRDYDRPIDRLDRRQQDGLRRRRGVLDIDAYNDNNNNNIRDEVDDILNDGYYDFNYNNNNNNNNNVTMADLTAMEERIINVMNPLNQNDQLYQNMLRGVIDVEDEQEYDTWQEQDAMQENLVNELLLIQQHIQQDNIYNVNANDIQDVFGYGEVAPDIQDNIDNMVLVNNKLQEERKFGRIYNIYTYKVIEDIAEVQPDGTIFYHYRRGTKVTLDEIDSWPDNLKRFTNRIGRLAVTHGTPSPRVQYTEMASDDVGNEIEVQKQKKLSTGTLVYESMQQGNDGRKIIYFVINTPKKINEVLEDTDNDGNYKYIIKRAEVEANKINPLPEESYLPWLCQNYDGTKVIGRIPGDVAVPIDVAIAGCVFFNPIFVSFRMVRYIFTKNKNTRWPRSSSIEPFTPAEYENFRLLAAAWYPKCAELDGSFLNTRTWFNYAEEVGRGIIETGMAYLFGIPPELWNSNFNPMKDNNTCNDYERLKKGKKKVADLFVHDNISLQQILLFIFVYDHKFTEKDLWGLVGFLPGMGKGKLPKNFISKTPIRHIRHIPVMWQAFWDMHMTDILSDPKKVMRNIKKKIKKLGRDILNYFSNTRFYFLVWMLRYPIWIAFETIIKFLTNIFGSAKGAVDWSFDFSFKHLPKIMSWVFNKTENAPLFSLFYILNTLMWVDFLLFLSKWKCRLLLGYYGQLNGCEYNPIYKPKRDLYDTLVKLKF